MSARPSLGDPAVLLATWFGAGLIRPAPGTWGTLAALPFAWGLWALGGVPGLLAGTGLAFAVGIWAAGRHGALTGRHDDGAVVIDEVAGMWLTLAFVPATLSWWIAAFLAFRLFDIVKPWPIAWADRRVKGGVGVMLDDILAALMAGALLLLVGQLGQIA